MLCTYPFKQLPVNFCYNSTDGIKDVVDLWEITEETTENYYSISSNVCLSAQSYSIYCITVITYNILTLLGRRHG
jgi:hypothetical protein